MSQPHTVSADFSSTPPVVGSPLRFVPVTPCRVVDTRNPVGPLGGPSLSAGSRDFPIPSSSCGIPATALAYSMNVTVVPHGNLGYLSIWPAGQPQPVVSTLNSFDGRIKADAAIVPAGVGGEISLYATNPTDVSPGYQRLFRSGRHCRQLELLSGFAMPIDRHSQSGRATRWTIARGWSVAYDAGALQHVQHPVYG